MTNSANDSARRPFKWGFFSASAVILVLVAAGQAVGALLGRYPPAQAVLAAMRGDSADARSILANLFGEMGGRDWLFTAFLVSAAVYVIVQRAALRRFFRSMHTGVSLVSLSVVAVILGVLVPQIKNFEDPEERVTKENYEANYSEFRWAESYFLYHLLRPYGIGMPEAPIPQTALAGLDRFARVYGKEEADNRRKMMESSMTGPMKADEIEAFGRRHDGSLRKAFDVATALELNRLYKSSWFATLLLLLGTAVAFNTFKSGFKSSFRIAKIGFVVTHFGIMTLLVGGGVSKLLTDRGILELWRGEPAKDTYYRHYRNDKRARMPFGVRLDHFARKEWKALEVEFPDADLTTRLPRHTLWPGREIPLDWSEDEAGKWRPNVLLRVLELHDRAEVAMRDVVEGDPADGLGAWPLVELRVPAPEHDHEDPADHAAHAEAAASETQRLYLSPRLRNQGYADPARAWRMVVAYGADPRSVFPPDPDRVLGTLDVELSGAPNAMPMPVPVRIGERIPVGLGYEVEFLQATGHVRFARSAEEVIATPDPSPLADQGAAMPGVWIHVWPPEGGEPERRLVLEAVDPIEYGLQSRYAHRQVIARLRWDAWSAPGPPRWVLAYGPDTGPRLVCEDGLEAPVEAGEPLPLPGDTPVAALRFLHFARFPESGKNIHFLPNQVDDHGWDATFYSAEPRGLVLEIVRRPPSGDETSETVRMATTPAWGSDRWISEDHRFGIRFLENAEGFPFDWRSVLSVVERDGEGSPFVVPLGPEKAREIRVNDYFQYRGYRFFQTNATPEDPDYSGIGVVYDPGIPIVLAGMYTIIAGTLLAFIVRPIVLARRRKEVFP
ncbi:MAG TPA: hypothetical protein VMS76_16970 [Planctomycetota bacterium]|nr:hypothetical protein [Planctomycetota bacterium]